MPSIDAANLVQPETVILTRRTLGKLRKGEVLYVRASDPASIKDIPSFCSNNGHTLITAYEKESFLFFEIRKGGLQQ